MVGFMKETDDEVPYRHGDYLYYTRTVKGLAYKLHCRMLHGAAGEEAVILDENQLAEGNDYCDVGSCEPSPSHRLL
ncbi:dapb1, partial [Symbiodinium microadriaticum]